jgi:hypothetical protein
MLLKRFPPPSGAGLFVSRSTAISPSHARRCRRVDFPTFMSTSTSTPTAAFPIRNSHPSILQSADLDSHPDIELEKHLGINRKVDRDPSSSQRHHHNSNFDSHDPNGSHNPSGGNRKHLSNDPGPSQPPRKSTGKKKMEITDREWDIRTGELFFGIRTLKQEFDATLQNLSHSMPYISAIIYSKQPLTLLIIPLDEQAEQYISFNRPFLIFSPLVSCPIPPIAVTVNAEWSLNTKRLPHKTQFLKPLKARKLTQTHSWRSQIASIAPRYDWLIPRL